MLLLRFCTAMLSACIVSAYMPSPIHFIRPLVSCWDSGSERCHLEMLWYENLAVGMRVVTGALWVITWLIMEIYTKRQSDGPVPKVLTHFRYGPLAILFLSFVTIFSTDFLLVQYSKWQLVQYIYSDAPVTEPPSIVLHNTYRHWCGNGMAATRYELYGSTPSEYIDDPDPATRARALQASMYVYDWINDPRYGPSMAALNKATMDSDPMVRTLAARINRDLQIHR